MEAGGIEGQGNVQVVSEFEAGSTTDPVRAQKKNTTNKKDGVTTETLMLN